MTLPRETKSHAVPVLAYHEYLGRDSQTVYTTHHYCGECRLKIDKAYDFPEFPEQLEAEMSWRSERKLAYIEFCPWCGVRFEDGWWRNQVIQNERAIDHYQNPGHHKGDTHEFRGKDENCYVNHWLGVSGGDKLCWCDPEVEPGLMGCTIRHQDKDYETVMAELRAGAPTDEDWDEDSDA